MAPPVHRYRLSREPQGSGLCCAPAGVSLAGVPLLRQAAHGLAPREPWEISALLKSAYDEVFSEKAIANGLKVAAEALNQGDLGRAMIATLQLGLPDLSSRGAARIACADQLLKGYNPDEPRDARGRWTAGGPQNPSNPSPPGPRRSPPAPERSVRPRTAHRRDSSDRPNAPFMSGHGPMPSSDTLKPILISDEGPREPDNDNFVNLPARLLGKLYTMSCIHNARDPDYQSKVEDCAAAGRKCDFLISLGLQFPRRQDYCRWPDGSAAIIKSGLPITVSTGHFF